MTKLCIISTVKAPFNQLKLFINYHLKIGIDEIILFFDDPRDAAINQLSNQPKITLIPCSDNYWKNIAGTRPESIEDRQIINVNKGILYAKEKNCNWVMHIDSDELIHPKHDIKNILDDYNADGVRFELLEAVADKKHYDHIFLPTLFKKKSSKIQIKLAGLLGCNRSIYDGEYLRGHMSSKMAIKLDGKIIKHGIHEPLEYGAPIEVIDTKKIQLLHYDCIGINNWKLKWGRRLDGSAAAENMRGNRKRQFSEYKRAADSGESELMRTYEYLHTIPISEKLILTMLGMLEKVDIQKNLKS